MTCFDGAVICFVVAVIIFDQRAPRSLSEDDLVCSAPERTPNCSWTDVSTLDKLALTDPLYIRAHKETFQGHVLSALVHRIRLEKPAPPASQNAPDPVRNYDGDWGICGIGRILALI